MSSWEVLPAFVLDQIFGFQTANKLRDRDAALAASRIGGGYLGGSRALQPVKSASFVDVPDHLPLELDGTNIGGLTVQARVFVRTTNTGTSVQAKIRNVTDGSDAVVGAAYSADTVEQAQTLVFVPVTGVKIYHLQVSGNNDTNNIFARGYVERFVDP